MTLLHVLVYLSLVVFIVAMAALRNRLAKMPLHLRWELYPVPHERGRGHYGGSMMEEVDFWKKDREVDHISELKVMFTEIIFLKAVWEHNRQLWFASWTMHFGLYLLIGLMFLQIVAGLLMNFAAVTFTSGWSLTIALLMRYLAVAGFGFGILGALLMLVKRLTVKEMKMMNTPSHFFNLFLLAAMSISGILWMFSQGNFISEQRMLFASIFTLSKVSALPVAAYVHIGLILFFLIYVPFTHMSHFLAKYFTYHNVRWEDEPNKPGGKLEARIKENLSQPVSWSAAHIQADGKKSWGDLAGLTGNEINKDAEGK